MPSPTDRPPTLRHFLWKPVVTVGALLGIAQAFAWAMPTTVADQVRSVMDAIPTYWLSSSWILAMTAIMGWYSYREAQRYHRQLVVLRGKFEKSYAVRKCRLLSRRTAKVGDKVITALEFFVAAEQEFGQGTDDDALAIVLMEKLGAPHDATIARACALKLTNFLLVEHAVERIDLAESLTATRRPGYALGERGSDILDAHTLQNEK